MTMDSHSHHGSNANTSASAGRSTGASSGGSTDQTTCTGASNGLLPWDFVPGHQDVICGKAAKQHSGALWCRGLVEAEMKGEPRDTAEIIRRVVTKVKNANPEGGFVRFNALHARWVQVTDHQASRKVLQIIQDVVQSKRLRQAQARQSQNAQKPSGRHHHNFLEEYVQTHAMNPTVSSSLFVAAGDISRKRRRIVEPQPQQQQQQLQDDVQLQSFLRMLAAGVPDIIVDNPFEPDPIANTQGVAEPANDSTVARLLADSCRQNSTQDLSSPQQHEGGVGASSDAPATVHRPSDAE